MDYVGFSALSDPPSASPQYGINWMFNQEHVFEEHNQANHWPPKQHELWVGEWSIFEAVRPPSHPEWNTRKEKILCSEDGVQTFIRKSENISQKMQIPSRLIEEGLSHQIWLLPKVQTKWRLHWKYSRKNAFISAEVVVSDTLGLYYCRTWSNGKNKRSTKVAQDLYRIIVLGFHVVWGELE